MIKGIDKGDLDQLLLSETNVKSLKNGYDLEKFRLFCRMNGTVVAA